MPDLPSPHRKRRGTKSSLNDTPHAETTAAPLVADGDTESRILEAARRVFIRRGTAGARMQEIAAEAGVNQALVHYYFGSKNALAERVAWPLRRPSSDTPLGLPRRMATPFKRRMVATSAGLMP